MCFSRSCQQYQLPLFKQRVTGREGERSVFSTNILYVHCYWARNSTNAPAWNSSSAPAFVQLCPIANWRLEGSNLYRVSTRMPLKVTLSEVCQLISISLSQQEPKAQPSAERHSSPSDPWVQIRVLWTASHEDSVRWGLSLRHAHSSRCLFLPPAHTRVEQRLHSSGCPPLPALDAEAWLAGRCSWLLWRRSRNFWNKLQARFYQREFTELGYTPKFSPVGVHLQLLGPSCIR